MGVNDKPDDPFANVSKAIAAGDDLPAGELPETKRKAAPKPKGEWVCSVPADAPDARASHNSHGKPSASWRYCDAGGRLIHWACRFDKPDGSKEILPQTLWREGGRLGWRWGAPPVPRPLYGLDRLALAPAAPVLIVEGEKTADAAAGLFPGFAVASWSGGSKAVSKADWAALAGRRVAIMPDADTPGREAAQAVRKAALAAGVAHHHRHYRDGSVECSSPLPAAIPPAENIGASNRIYPLAPELGHELPEDRTVVALPGRRFPVARIIVPKQRRIVFEANGTG